MLNRKRIIILLMILCVLIMLFYVNYKAQYPSLYSSLGKLTKAVVQAYQNQDTQALQSCYRKTNEQIIQSAEIEFEKKFYLSANAEKIIYKDYEILINKGEYFYVGVAFDFHLSSGEIIPYYAYFIVYGETDQTFYMVTESDCPRDVLDYFEAEKSNHQDTDLYQQYLKEEEAYRKKNPSYADETYQRFVGMLSNIPYEMRRNLQFLAVIFGMSILQIVTLYLWASEQQRQEKIKKYNKYRGTKN